MSPVGPVEKVLKANIHPRFPKPLPAIKGLLKSPTKLIDNKGFKKMTGTQINKLAELAKFAKSRFEFMQKKAVDFGTPFNGNNSDKKLSREELARAVRFAIAAEYEAVQLYGQIADSTDNADVKKIMNSVLDEERVHAGEFLELLKKLDPEEQQKYDEGAREARKEMRTKK